MQDSLVQLRESIRVLDAIRHRDVSAVRIGLAASPRHHPEVVPLGTAIVRGSAEITEQGDGVVACLSVTNRHRSAYLFGMVGELLVGGRQDRVLNTSVLIAPGRQVTVPVSCVERGRWHGDHRHFRCEGLGASSAVRAEVTRITTLSMSHGYRSSDGQQRVWGSVERTLVSRNTSSGTSALRDTYVKTRPAVEEYVTMLPTVEEQYGLALFANNRLSGVDLFTNSSLLRHYASVLVRGAALDTETPTAMPLFAMQSFVQDLFRRLAEAKLIAERTDDLGYERRFRLGEHQMSALFAEGQLISLSIIRDAEENSSPAPFGSTAGSACRVSISLASLRGHGGEGLDEGTVAHESTIASESTAADMDERMLQLRPGAYHLGRCSACDIQLDSPQVSRYHARLVIGEEGLHIEDLQSTNGTQVNGSPVHRSPLREGDLVVLGGVELRILPST